MTHWLLSNVLFSLQLFAYFLLLLLLLSSSFIAMWSGRMQGLISVFLYLLRLALCPKIWSILEKVPWTAEKNEHCAFPAFVHWEFSSLPYPHSPEQPQCSNPTSAVSVRLVCSLCFSVLLVWGGVFCCAVFLFIFILLY
jgi:hypothetical protein